jgi:hypothetical protein
VSKYFASIYLSWVQYHFVKNVYWVVLFKGYNLYCLGEMNLMNRKEMPRLLQEDLLIFDDSCFDPILYSSWCIETGCSLFCSINYLSEHFITKVDHEVYADSLFLHLLRNHHLLDHSFGKQTQFTYEKMPPIVLQ